MKPFNLQEALAGKPVVTRDGRKVTQLHLFECDAKVPLFGFVENSTCIYQFRKDGQWISEPSGLNLFMASTEKTVWVNLYHGWTGGYDSQEIADAWARHLPATPRFGGKAFPITYEE